VKLIRVSEDNYNHNCQFFNLATYFKGFFFLAVKEYLPSVLKCDGSVEAIQKGKWVLILLNDSQVTGVIWLNRY